MVIVLRVLQLLVAAIALFVAIELRAPLLASLRTELLAAMLVGSFLTLGLSAISVPKRFAGARESNKIISKLLNTLAVVVICAALISFSVAEVRFHLAKQAVFEATAADLSHLGRHLIVGYQDLAEVKILAEKQAISGVFLTTRNVEGKSAAEIKAEIQSLQEIRASQGLSPLWIATDQEGGVVSRLSPPLTLLPSLSKAIAPSPDAESRTKAVIQYANTQGRELAALGINLNFAPVVDLNKNIVNPDDRFSQIYRRAISSDRAVVSQVALQYCQTLAENGVRCTLKHFPGLGRISEDTHLESARLQSSVSELSRDDWVPFREVMKNSGAFTMLGHAILTAVDRDRPVSFSKRAIAGILRQDWQHDGILVTDDFCMYAVYRSKAGFRKATVAALNAGVDLILIAYDSDLYYPAMSALLNADRAGALDWRMLEKSEARLQREQPVS